MEKAGVPVTSYGACSEEQAADILRERGYTVIGRNFRSRHGEVDIIAYEGDTLVFIEVKARRGKKFGDARWAVDQRKQKAIARAALLFLSRKKISKTPCRFDVVLIEEGSTGRKIEVIKNAFDLTACGMHV